MSNHENVWEFYGQPYEPPPHMDYQIGPREFASVTAMGNWYAMQSDRDRWRAVAEQLAEQIGNIDYAKATYKDLGATS